jgi:hypothetical protein
MTAVSVEYGFAHEHIGASVTEKVLGTTGAIGDYLHRFVITVGTAATSQVTVNDGAFSHILVRPNTPIGVYSIEMNTICEAGPWKVTTAAGVEVLAMGNFT